MGESVEDGRWKHWYRRRKFLVKTLMKEKHQQVTSKNFALPSAAGYKIVYNTTSQPPFPQKLTAYCGI